MNLSRAPLTLKQQLPVYYLFCLIVLFSFCLTGIAIAQTYTPPAYKNGPADFTRYLNKYCSLCGLMPHEKNYEEVYTYTITIAKDGSVKFVTIQGKDLDVKTELKRIMRLSDNWQPGMVNNQPVDTFYSDFVRVCSTVNTGKVCNGYDSIRTLQCYIMGVEIGFPFGEINPNKGLDDFNKGKEYFAAKEYAKSISCFNRAITNHYVPYWEPTYNIGVCYLQLGNTDSACSYIIKAARYGDSESEKIYKQLCRNNKATSNSLPKTDEPTVTEAPAVYTFTDVMPEYIDGTSNLLPFLAHQIHYPPYALEKGIDGTVQLRFIVLENGSVSDIEVKSSPDESLTREAVRVAALLKFKPALVKDKPVKCYYNLPIRFGLH